MYKKESLEKLLVLIDEICKDNNNLWFRKSLEFKFSGTRTNLYDEQVFTNTEKIKYYLSLSPELSIDYSYIPHKTLRARLELDNLRMEGVRLDMQEKKEFTRFFDYLVFAFYQVENLINFYYYDLFPVVDDLIDHLESIEGTRFRGNNSITNIGDIPIATKIYSFNKTFFNIKGNYTGHTIDNLRKVRNEGVHRCSILAKSPMEERNNLQKFLKFATYDSILSDLTKLSNTVEGEF
ncbi:hypothetical protein BTO09_06480 [Gilvibacter sp. SZ-19]|uniref:hypothetical protein n=1 Tax=Gilvibacter sp. SZ-19 TaxID=754429 RepID=UPI000B3CC334|nr:hypothetical protein [Gilvibacter sp. SZ-19]ARV12013.1 hypothetical protein BTO09_06480 [Gilvibacter sp. SZ-19]